MSFRIAFIQDEERTQHGIMFLSAVLKKHNFSTRVFIKEAEEGSFIEKILAYEPNIIGATVMTPGYRRTMELFTILKKRSPNSFFIIGGPHPTFYPDVIYQEECLDAICRGEGEYPLLELAASLRENNLNTKIKNLWIKHCREVFKNDMRELIDDIDALPFPDREIYFEEYPQIAKLDIKIMVGRGCPYNCSYCFNKGMKDLYSNKGSWVRLRHIDKIIEEIKEIDSKYPIKWINIHDDTFNINKEWAKKFLRVYREKIGIPFLCQLRIDKTDEELIELLKQANVDRITVGIEHGDEEIRKNLLKRDISNNQIIDFGKWVNKRKIRLHTTNIMGFPNEDLEKVFLTISINSKLKPELAISNILNPYPGTDIYKYCRDYGYLKDNFSFNEMTGQNVWASHTNHVRSEVKNEYIPQMMNLRCFFMLLVKYIWLKPLIKILIKFPNNAFYEFIWKASNYFRIDWRYANCWKERKLLLKKLFQ